MICYEELKGKNKLIKIECSANIYIYILAYEQNIFLMIFLISMDNYF